MKADTVLTAIIAVCCVFAVGATSTTLDSTVSTDPEDVAQVEYEKLPVGEGDARELDEAIDGDGSAEGDDRSQSGPPTAAADSESGDGEPRQGERDGDGGDARQERDGESDEESRQKQSGANERETQSAGGSSADADSGDGPMLTEPTLLERLVSLLRDLLDALSTALPFAVVLVALGAAVRYRDGLLSRVAPTADDGGGGASEFDPDPDDAVAAAWFEMVDRLDLADSRHLTPRECAEAARRRDVDPDAVRRLTALFEEVRYGGARVTEERRRRAEESIRRVRTQLEGR